MNDTKIGVITSGIPYQYVKEALPNASVLKLGMVNPLPRKLIEDFASKVEKLYIVEELDPVIEEQVKSWGIKATGKEIFTVQGEYSANMLREAILGEELKLDAPAAAPGRPPILCPGCPHRSVYYVLNKLKMHAAGDIGLVQWHRLVLSIQRSVWVQVFPVFMEWRKQKAKNILRTG